MPPKARYTKDEIVEAAFQMARENGIESIAARELGKRLGTSSSPIFTAFHNMQELLDEVRKKAMKTFEASVENALQYPPAFKYVGFKMIQFATEEPKLFQLLYMQKHEKKQNYDDLISDLGDTANVCIEVIQNDYDLTRQEAELLFRQVWLYTFGICNLLANKICYFTEEEISQMLTNEFRGTLMLIQSGEFIVTTKETKR